MTETPILSSALRAETHGRIGEELSQVDADAFRAEVVGHTVLQAMAGRVFLDGQFVIDDSAVTLSCIPQDGSYPGYNLTVDSGKLTLGKYGEEFDEFLDILTEGDIVTFIRYERFERDELVESHESTPMALEKSREMLPVAPKPAESAQH